MNRTRARSWAGWSTCQVNCWGWGGCYDVMGPVSILALLIITTGNMCPRYVVTTGQWPGPGINVCISPLTVAS